MPFILIFFMKKITDSMVDVLSHLAKVWECLHCPFHSNAAGEFDKLAFLC